MEYTELKVPGAWAIETRQVRDPRGVFLEQFKAEALERATGRRLDLAQANISVSRRGVLRGLHFADTPPGQAKYVVCTAGAVLDVVVDVRVGSATFGTWDAVRLDDVDRRAVFASEGLGHAFLSLSEGAVVSYLCSTGYAPGREHGVHPLDPDIGIEWPTDLAPLLSEKDAAAPSLAHAREQGLLPTMEDCRATYAALAPRP